MMYYSRNNPGKTTAVTGLAITPPPPWAGVVLGIGGLPEASHVELFGYSQGGGASGSAVVIAAAYAPELPPKGAFVGAPPSNLQRVAQHADGSLLTGVLFGAAWSAGGWTNTSAEVDDLFAPVGKAIVRDVTTSCVIPIGLKYGLRQTSWYTKNGRPLAEALDRPLWKPALHRNLLGKTSDPGPKAPVLLYNSHIDPVTPMDQTLAVKNAWCSRGAAGGFRTNHAPGHIAGMLSILPEAARFMDSTLRGQHTTKSSC